MTFFNKKEEILEIKLTPHGKRMLSQGKFKPTYYAFFDDDVLYEGARAGVSEDNNNIEPRIQENTPSLRAQTSFTDLEKLVLKQTHDIIDGACHENNVNDFKHDPSVFEDYDATRNILPIGTSQLGNQHAAAWKVQFLEGRFKASTNCINDDPNVKTIINIPQITCDLEVQPRLVSKDFKGVSDPVSGKYVALNPDTSQFIRLENDYLLLDISEHNVDLLNDSFSLEVYEVTTEDNKEVLKPKAFKREIQTVVDGLMLDKEEIEAQIYEGDLDVNFVEYFFEISVDSGIDNKTRKEKIVSQEVRGSIFDSNIGADDYTQTPGSELYTSDNDGEDC